MNRLRLLAGRRYAIIARSGTGKSTLLDTLGLRKPPDRAVEFLFRPRNGPVVALDACWRRADSKALSALRREEIGLVPQSGGLLPFITVRQNIELPGQLRGNFDPQRAEELADHLEISAQLNKFPGELSVGERQRVAVARAVFNKPSFIIADEPTSALDPQNASRVLSLLCSQVSRIDASLVVATHDRALLESAEDFTRLSITSRQSGPDVVRSEIRLN